MNTPPFFDKIDLQLIRTLHTLLTERSVSRTALLMGQQQPAISQALRRLRDLLGDPILVRSGNQMVPTDVGLGLLAHSGQILASAQALMGSTRQFDPAHSAHRFNLAVSDTIDPAFLPDLVVRLHRLAPHCSVHIHPLTWQAEYLDALSQGQLDVVIANWEDPSEQLHRAPLFDDEVVSLVSAQHPAVRRGWTLQDWLDCDHVAPTPAYVGWRGVIDQQLDAQGLERHIAVRCGHFSLIPAMVASSLLVLTTGRRFCERMTQGQSQSQNANPWVMLPPPFAFKPMTYHQLWHERSHASAPARWLRDQVKASAMTNTVNPPLRSSPSSRSFALGH